MKILLISSNSSGSGGGEQYLVYLAIGLKELGNEVTVLLSRKKHMDIWKNKFSDVKINVERANLLGLNERPLRILQSSIDKKQINTISSICAKIQPDLIHVNQQYDADGIDYLLGVLEYRKTPFVSTIHMPMSLTKHIRPKNIKTLIINALRVDYIKTAILKNWYKKHTFTKIFVAKAMKTEFVSVYNDEKNANIVINGVDISKIPFPLEEKNKNIIAFCGRLDPQKNLFLLIKSWLNARQKGLNHKLFLIGDGILRKNIESYLKRKAPEGSWQITGWAKNPMDYIKNIDLFVTTSIFEGVPLALLEAACAGKKCLSVNYSGLHGISEKIPFLSIVKSHQIHSVGEALIENVKKDTPKREDVEKVRSFFSYKRMTQDTLNIYKIAIKKWKNIK